jgi:cytidyltransferase-like protein
VKIFESLDILERFTRPVLTIGNYDGIHAGHRKIIERVKQKAKELSGTSMLMTFHPHPMSVLRPDKYTRIITPLYLKKRLVEATGIHVLVVQNALAIPMHVPLGLALSRFIAESGIPAIGHHHDFFWERERFRVNAIPDLLWQHFPPDLPSLRHVVINSLAQRDLKIFRRLDAVVLPNVFDYDTPPPVLDDYNRDFRAAMGFSTYDWLFLQPTRVVARKGIEISFELLRRLREPRARLVITHQAGDEGMAYYRQLLHQAQAADIEVHYLAGFIEEQRIVRDGRKHYTLWDVYPHADFVTYPTLYEGFGNALLEAIYFRKPMLVNRYSVYVADIAPLGFDFVEVDGWISDESLSEVRRLLDDAGRRQAMVEHNFALAREHFSYRTAEGLLQEVLDSLL